MGKHAQCLSGCSVQGVDLLMIFVTLGTNDKSFARLLKAVEHLLETGVIKDRVVV